MTIYMTKEMKAENQIEIDKSLTRTKELIHKYLRNRKNKLKRLKVKLNKAKSSNLKEVYKLDELYKQEKKNCYYIDRVIVPKCNKILESIDNGNYNVDLENSLKDEMVIDFAFVDFSATYINDKVNINIWSKKDGAPVLKILTIGDKQNETGIRVQECD